MRVNIPKQAIMKKVMNAFDNGLPFLTEEILNDCNQYAKEDTGMLIQSSYIHTEFSDGVLVWQTPYAKRQYWDIKTSLMPGRTWKWAEYAKARHLSQWQRQAQILMEKYL